MCVTQFIKVALPAPIRFPFHVVEESREFSKEVETIDIFRPCSAATLFTWEKKNSVQLNFFFPREQ